MAEHSYQKVGLLNDDSSEHVEDAGRTIQRSSRKSWMGTFLPYFTFHLLLLALYTFVTFLIIRHTKIELPKKAASHTLTYSKGLFTTNYICLTLC